MITYNKLGFLKKSLPAIASSVTEPDVELIVYANGCTDGTNEFLEEFAYKCPAQVKYKYFIGDENLGLNAYSEVVKFARGEIIVTADDDILKVAVGWERRFIAALKGRFDGNQFGYVCADTINIDSGRVETIFGAARIGGEEIEIGVVGGWFTATTREVMEDIGGFHSGKPLMHLEDYDYQVRAWKKGYLCGTHKGIKVYHAASRQFYERFGCLDTYDEKQVLLKDALLT